jgi:hypothetical protein
MTMSLNLNAEYNINSSLGKSDVIIRNMALSLVPGLGSLLTTKQLNYLRGNIRRGNLDVMQSPFLLEKLELMKSQQPTGCAKSFLRLYQFISLLKKLPTRGNDRLCKENGLNKFRLGEDKCRMTNTLLKSDGYFSIDSNMARIRDIIQDILGPLGSSFLNTEVAFGPGSTVNNQFRKYTETSEFFKLTDTLIIPEKAKSYLAAHLSSNATWVDSLKCFYHLNDTQPIFELEKEIFKKHFRVVPNNFPNKLGFVPKDKDEHRVIGVELNGQVLLQMILGGEIRTRLLYKGLDLNTQGRNRHFARFAKTFEMATIDLKNASNTLSYQTVKQLLPYDWFQALDTFRTSHGTENSTGEHFKYEMFSSMGNGFTFELESLIFFAISMANVMKGEDQNFKQALRQVTVFGDDIIVPQKYALAVISDLNLFGFEVNQDKSYLSGNFYESCGSDFYDGIDVRPFFLKRNLVQIKDLYFLCNSLLYKIIKTGSNFLVAAYQSLSQSICKSKYLPGPLHFYEGKDGWRESSDDLEACLRVPLSYAQHNKGVKFNCSLFAYTYRKMVNVAVVVPLSEHYQYPVQLTRYMMFLRGATEGKAVLRGCSVPKLIRHETSSWDGVFSPKVENLVLECFESP